MSEQPRQPCAGRRRKLRLCLSLFASFFKISLLTFGGGMAMIPFFHRELVGRRKWVADEELVDMVSIGLAVPGPISTNLAVQVGRRAAGPPGAACAFLGMVAPPLLLAIASALALHAWADRPGVRGFLKGASAAVVGLIAYGAYILGRRMISSVRAVLLCLALVAAVIFLGANPLLALFAATAVEAYFARRKENNGNTP